MYTMSIDFAFLLIAIISIIASAYNKAREKNAKGTRENVQPKMTPSEILKKLNEYKVERDQEPLEVEVPLTPEEIKEKKEKIRTKYEAEKIAKHEARKKRRKKRDTLIEKTAIDKSESGFSHQDWRRAIVTKEILDKPKALRNDLY